MRQCLLTFIPVFLSLFYQSNEWSIRYTVGCIAPWKVIRACNMQQYSQYVLEINLCLLRVTSSG